MKKSFLLLFILFCFCLNVSAEEFDFFDKSTMDAFENSKRMKPVNEQDYQKVMKNLQEKKDKGKQPKRHFWQKKPKKLEGTPLQNGTTGGILAQPYLLVQISQTLFNDECIIPQGFYTVAFNSTDSTLHLKQGHTIMAVVKMTKTPIEPQTDDLYYVKTNPKKDGVEFLYGEIDKHYEGFCGFYK
jgi:hypothetical protein